MRVIIICSIILFVGPQGDCGQLGGQRRQNTEGGPSPLYKRPLNKGNYSPRSSEHSKSKDKSRDYNDTLLARPSCPLSLSVLGCQDKSDAY